MSQVHLPARRFEIGQKGAYPLTLTRADGRSTLVGFKQLDDLVAAFGSDQPWFAVTDTDWTRMQQEAGVPLLLDPTPADIAEWGSVDG